MSVLAADTHLCKCVCGRATPVAKRTRRDLGHVAGQPTDYVVGRPTTGRPMSVRMRKRISAKLKGHPVSDAARAKMGRQGPAHPRWRGGRFLNSSGYVEVLLPDEHPLAEMRTVTGRVREHRLVMAEHLGRPLQPSEIVHHINECRSDNRLENLQLFASSREHSAFHAAASKRNA